MGVTDVRRLAFHIVVLGLVGCGPAAAQITLGYGNTPPAPSTLVPSVAAGPAQLGSTLSNSFAAPSWGNYGAPQVGWGNYGSQGFTTAPPAKGLIYGVDSTGTAFYSDPNTGITQYYGTSQVRNRRR